MIAIGTAAQLRRSYGIQPQQLGHWRRIGKAEVLADGAPKVWRVHLDEPCTLPALLAEYRRRAGLSQAELADAVDCHQQALQRYETGQSEPGTLRLHAMLTRLGTTMGEFFAHLEGRRPLPPVPTKRQAVPVSYAIWDAALTFDIQIKAQASTPRISTLRHACAKAGVDFLKLIATAEGFINGKDL
jgi:transcriptional regulator with XRE-family HTH domain